MFKKNKLISFFLAGGCIVFVVFLFVHYFGLLDRQFLYYSSLIKPGIIENTTPDESFDSFSYNRSISRFSQLIYGSKADFVIQNSANFSTVHGYVDIVDLDDLYVDVEITDASGKAVFRQHLANAYDSIFADSDWIMSDIDDRYYVYGKKPVEDIEDVFSSDALISYFNIDLFEHIDRTAPSSFTTFDVPFQGSHVLQVYIDDGLSVSGKYTDRNLVDGPDRFNVVLTKDGAPVKNFQIQDDGIQHSDGVRVDDLLYDFDFSDVSSGVYELRFDVSDDIVVNSLVFNPVYYAFADRFRIPGGFDFDVTEFGFFGDSAQILIDGGQESGRLQVDGQSVLLGLENKRYQFSEKCDPEIITRDLLRCYPDFFFEGDDNMHALAFAKGGVDVDLRDGYLFFDQPFPFMRSGVRQYEVGDELLNSDFVIFEKTMTDDAFVEGSKSLYEFFLPLPEDEKFRIRFVNPLEERTVSPEMLEITDMTIILGK